MTAHAEARRGIRDLLGRWRADPGFAPRCDAWLSGLDPDFSRALGRAGFLGMAWSSAYGGSDRTFRERFVVTEELLRAGAPVSAHWIADRQIGPAVAELGSERLKHELLPRIARGEACVCLGMSEPDSGSDLASVRTRLEPDGDGYLLHGHKIWTSNAHVADYAYVLARTDAAPTERHEGLTECLVTMDQPGIEVRPIRDLRDEHHFNEVFLDGARVPRDGIIGEVGDGWRQVTEQLSLERGGPERVLSTYPLLARCLDSADPDDGHARAVLGGLVARLAALRSLAWAVAGRMDAGEAPVVEAAGLKLQGTRFEVDVVEAARDLAGGVVPPDDADAGLWRDALLASPGFSIRGGTTEVLTTILARHCAGEVDQRPVGTADGVSDVVARVLGDAWERGDTAEQHLAVWDVARDLGWPLLGADEQRGGVGGTLADRLRLAELLGAHGQPGPYVEANTAAVGLGGHEAVPAQALARGEVAVVAADDFGGSADRTHLDDPGAVTRVLVVDAGRLRAGVVAAETASSPGGDPLRVVRAGETIVNDGALAAALRRDLDLLRCARLVGACEAAARLSARHATDREQFGRPLWRFQALAGLIAEQRAAAELARAALDGAVDAPGEAHPPRTDAAVRTCGDAADRTARLAHQVHGAMGFTREHPLHRITRRLWTWRDQLGADHARADRLGRWAATTPEPDVWHLLSPDLAASR